MIRQLLACLAAAPLLAQVATPPQIIGFTAQNSATTPSASVTSQVLCNRPVSCPSPLPMPSVPWGGGAAYNATNSSLWHTQGTRLVEVELRNCTVLCAAPANLTLGATSVASGLAVSEARHELYQLETDVGTAAITTRGGQKRVVSTCRVPMPANTMHAGGLAYDRQNDLLIYSVSQWNAVLPNNVAIFLRRADPNCAAVVCRIPLPACAAGRLGPITGLGMDCCSSTLYATDGRQTAVYRVDLANCVATPVACCVLNHPAGETWFGIDVEPTHPRAVGQSCIDGLCRPCNNMTLIPDGDPTIGNSAFALRVVDGQAGAVSLAFLGVGPCRVPGLPVLCGNFHLGFAPPPVFLGVAALAGVGCLGLAVHPAPIPLDWSLCGGVVCAQNFVVCLNALTPPGINMTNALQLTFE